MNLIRTFFLLLILAKMLDCADVVFAPALVDVVVGVGGNVGVANFNAGAVLVGMKLDGGD